MIINNQKISTELRVSPSWIDFNGHMNGGYFSVAFDIASVNLLAAVGIDDNYRNNSGHSTFALESHVCYLGELKRNDAFVIESYVYDYDKKRMHLYHEMHRLTKPQSKNASQETLVATSEVLSMHIDMSARKSSPYPDGILSRIQQMHDNHASYDFAHYINRKVAIRR